MLILMLVVQTCTAARVRWPSRVRPTNNAFPQPFVFDEVAYKYADAEELLRPDDNQYLGPSLTESAELFGGDLLPTDRLDKLARVTQGIENVVESISLLTPFVI
jgi:hypothetical protein